MRFPGFLLAGLLLAGAGAAAAAEDAPAPAAGGEAQPEPQLKTVEDVSAWMTGYYLRPRPELLAPAVLLLEKEGALEGEGNAAAPVASFLAQLFRQSPERLEGWLKELEGLKEASRPVVWLALWLADTEAAAGRLKAVAATAEGEQRKRLQAMLAEKPPDLLKVEVQGPAVLDMLWGAFAATGQADYVRRIIEVLPWAEAGKEDFGRMLVGGAARWSLVSNAVQHDRVLEICRQELARQPEAAAKLLKAVVQDAEKQRAEKKAGGKEAGE